MPPGSLVNDARGRPAAASAILRVVRPRGGTAEGPHLRRGGRLVIVERGGAPDARHHLEGEVEAGRVRVHRGDRGER